MFSACLCAKVRELFNATLSITSEGLWCAVPILLNATQNSHLDMPGGGSL